jgi:hypothetical protein
MTRNILNTPVTIEPSPKGPGFVHVAIKLVVFGKKEFDVPRADAEWVFEQLCTLLGCPKPSASANKS